MSEYLKTATVLYVEDNEEVRLGYTKALSRCAKEVYTAKNGIEGLELFVKYAPDIVISDIKMPDKDGIQLAQEIRQLNSEQIILFTTAYTEAIYTIPALELGINGYLVKPVDKKKLETKINELSRQIIAEKESFEQQLMLEQILNQQSSITLVTDFKTIKFASRSFWKMLHSEEQKKNFEHDENVLRLFIEHPYYIYGKTIESFLDKYNSCDSDMRLVSIITKNGPTAFYINIDKMHDGISEFFVITLTDVSSLQASRVEAVHRATHDNLTKIYNRNAFETYLEHELLRVKRYERPLCIALLDIDRFKHVNDLFGHLAGDDMLVMLSREINLSIRSTDVFARWGGEEFVILMSETTINKAQKVAQSIRQKVENLIHPIIGSITISIGVTQVTPEDTYKTLFERCDNALYQAKINGRNRVEVV